MWDESKHILFSSDEYSNIAKLLFSTLWNIVWSIKTNFLLKYYMQWLQEYCFPHVGTFSDGSKRIFFWIIVCNDCKNTIFCMSEYCVIVCSDCKSTILVHFMMNKNTFCFEVMNTVILQDYCFLPDGTLCDALKRIFFWSISTCWDLPWWIKTNFLLKYCMQWLKDYCFPHVGTFSDESKRIFF